VGESNHVYEVTDAGGHELIVRIASRADPRFTMEVAVMARARLAGVPVPEVLAVFRHDTPDGTMTAMVERRVPGQRLAVVAPTLDARSAATLATNLAEMLATIHAIRVHGYGTVDEHLAGQTATCSEWFIDRLPLDRAQTAVAADPRGAAVLDAAATALHRHRGLLDASPAQLAHGDYSPNNILVSGGEGRAARGTTLRSARTVIRGVIDWESAKGGHPAIDFGWWDWIYNRPPLSTEAIIDAYRGVRAINTGELTVLRALCLLRIHISRLAWSGADDGAQKRSAVQGLGEALARLGLRA